jgi:hypothetical protein
MESDAPLLGHSAPCMQWAACEPIGESVDLHITSKLFHEIRFLQTKSLSI